MTNKTSGFGPLDCMCVKGSKAVSRADTAPI